MPRNSQPLSEQITSFVSAARTAGFSQDTMTRSDCLAVREATGHTLPRWLMKDSDRRVSKGVYSIPELATEPEQVMASEPAAESVPQPEPVA